MVATSFLTDDEIQVLKSEAYNATVVEILECHEELRRIRVRPDGPPLVFQPGQYTILGLGNWEPLVARAVPDDWGDGDPKRVLKRAYSFSSPIFDPQGYLAASTTDGCLEFYIVLVRGDDERSPGLTPRLFALQQGDRLLLGHKANGRYLLDGVQSDDDVIFVATGTGEAPHNTMIVELLSRSHRGQIVAVCCTRRRRDLGYYDEYRKLEQRYASFQYLPLTTREAENLDPLHPRYVGKRYVQEFLKSGDLERTCGLVLAPAHTHIFLCGNPAMIGAPLRNRQGNERYPTQLGMVEVLEKRGFQIDLPKRRGNIHFEKYW